MKRLLISLFVLSSFSAYAENLKLNCKNIVGDWSTDPNGISDISLGVDSGCKEFDINCINQLQVDLYSKIYTLPSTGQSVHINTTISFSSRDKKFLADLIVDLIPRYVNSNDRSARRFNGESFKALLVLKQYYVNTPSAEVINLRCDLE